MNDHSQHINQYSAADIQKYLSGQMTASEMHALEKAALDDPFLADAIEGYQQSQQSHGADTVLSKLDELKAAITNRSGQGSAKPGTISWWKIAAAAVVILASGLYLWNSVLRTDEMPEPASQTIVALQEQDTGQHTIAPKDSSVEEKAAAVSNESLQTFKTPDADRQQISKQENRANSTERSKQQPARNQEISAFRSADVLPLQDRDQIILPDTSKHLSILSKEFAQKDAVPENEINRFNDDTTGRPLNTEVVGQRQRNAQPLALVNRQKDKKLSNVIRGRVVDMFNNPVANAYLRPQDPDESLNKTFFTDRDGFFNIPAMAKDSSELTSLNISVTASGFNPQQANLNIYNSNNNIQLTPGDAEAVIVSAYGKYKSLSKQIPETAIRQQNAEPAGGWTAYENYLRANNRIKALSDSSRAVKDVVVTFIVNRKGELSDLTITSGSTTEANEEAIRLIKEGPGWKLKRSRKSTVSVIVHF